MGWPNELELEAYVGHPVDTTRAELLLEAAKAACRDAASEVGAELVEQADDEVELDGNGADTLLLPGWPVTAITSVTVGDDTLDADEYEWSRVGELTRATIFTDAGWPGSRPRTFGAWPVGKRNITVVYTHGIAEADLPDEIKFVALAVAARMLANPQGFQQFSTDGTSATFGGGSGPQRQGRELVDEAERRTVIRAIR